MYAASPRNGGFGVWALAQGFFLSPFGAQARFGPNRCRFLALLPIVPPTRILYTLRMTSRAYSLMLIACLMGNFLPRYSAPIPSYSNNLTRAQFFNQAMSLDNVGAQYVRPELGPFERSGLVQHLPQATNDVARYLAIIEAAVQPIDDDPTIHVDIFMRHAWRQAILYYDTLLALLHRQGLFQDHTLIVPAAGVDAFPAYYSATIALDHFPLEKTALALAVRETQRDWEAYEKNWLFKLRDAFHSASYRYLLLDDIHTRHKSVLFKGVSGYLKLSELECQRYLTGLEEFLLPGDRIMVLNYDDHVAFKPLLEQRGWHAMEHWLSAPDLVRLRTAINLILTHPKNAGIRMLLNHSMSFFEVPTAFGIYEIPPHGLGQAV